MDHFLRMEELRHTEDRQIMIDLLAKQETTPQNPQAVITDALQLT